MAGTGPTPQKIDGKAGWVAEGKMRKLRVPLIILCVCSGLLLGAQKVNASQSVVFFYDASQLQNSEFSDGLDARDAANEPVTTKKAKDGLTEIFQSGLFNLLVNSELYSVAEVLSSLSRSLNLAAQNLVNNIPESIQNLIASFLPTIKQLQKILICLTGLFGFGFLVCKMLRATSDESRATIQLAPVVLRC